MFLSMVCGDDRTTVNWDYLKWAWTAFTAMQLTESISGIMQFSWYETYVLNIIFVIIKRIFSSITHFFALQNQHKLCTTTRYSYEVSPCFFFPKVMLQRVQGSTEKLAKSYRELIAIVQICISYSWGFFSSTPVLEKEKICA